MARRPRHLLRDPLKRIRYSPRAPYALDVEILEMRELRARVAGRHLQEAHRIDFHELICVTRGSCTHVVDFEPVSCAPGSVLVLHPSQAEQFDVTSPWDGWLVLFRPELLAAPAVEERTSDLNLLGMLAELPAHLVLDERERRLAASVLAQMQADSALAAPVPEVQALLRHQLCTLLLRLGMAHRRRQDAQLTPPSELRRFRHFQQLVEQSFAKWRRVADYAHALGCTEKTLTRATMGVAGVTPKAFIVSRIGLEAKRLLAHTSLPVAAVGDTLGFDDPSNFVKFFKREAGCTPMAFRRSRQAPLAGEPG